MIRPGRLGRCALLAHLFCLIVRPHAAAAQASAADKAAAEALFDQGVRLMQQHVFSDACSKLEESERIDPAVGTLLYLGECYERVGKTASAWATFREAASLAGTSSQADRARAASSRAQDLEARLSRLTIELAPEVARLPGVVVKRNGQRLDPSLYDTPLPVDPGEYRIDASAPGYDVWSTPIQVESGGASANVRVPGLEKTRLAAVAAPEVAQPPRKRSASPPTPAPAPAQGFTTWQILGISAGSVGVIGAGLGSYFGIKAIAQNSDAEPHCPEPGLCKDATGVDRTDKAQRNATASNVAFAASVVLVGAGAVLYLTSGRSTTERVALVPAVGPGAASATLWGRF